MCSNKLLMKTGGYESMRDLHMEPMRAGIELISEEVFEARKR